MTRRPTCFLVGRMVHFIRGLSAAVSAANTRAHGSGDDDTALVTEDCVPSREHVRVACPATGSCLSGAPCTSGRCAREDSQRQLGAASSVLSSSRVRSGHLEQTGHHGASTGQHAPACASAALCRRHGGRGGLRRVRRRTRQQRRQHHPASSRTARRQIRSPTTNETCEVYALHEVLRYDIKTRAYMLQTYNSTRIDREYAGPHDNSREHRRGNAR